MRLLAVPTSPYAARVMIQAYEKGLDLDISFPAPGQSIAEHAAANPFGRIPVLETPSGAVIESAAIQEYLEDLYPTPSLRPADALAAARMRGFILSVDHYLFAVILQLRGLGKDPSKDPDRLPGILASLDRVLDALQQMMNGDGYACGGQFTLADCALVPACFYLEFFLARLGQASVFAGRPRLQGWWETVNRHDSVTRVRGDLERAIARPPN